MSCRVVWSKSRIQKAINVFDFSLKRLHVTLELFIDKKIKKNVNMYKMQNTLLWH